MGAVETPSVVLQVIIASGMLTAVSTTIRWLLTRKSGHVDEAKVIQGMALDMLAPLNAQLATMTGKATDLSSELDSLLAWAVMARAILDAHSLAYPPVPAALRVQHPGD